MQGRPKIAKGVVSTLTEELAVLNVLETTPSLSSNDIGLSFTVPMHVIQSPGTLAFSFKHGGVPYVLYLTKE